MSDNKNRDSWTDYIQLGIELSLYVVLFFFAGYIGDIYLKTKPYLTVTGAVFGILSVFYVLWKKFLR